MDCVCKDLPIACNQLREALKSNYGNALGDVDLEEVATVASRVEKHNMNFLQLVLLDMGLPAIIDRTDQPRSHVTDDVTAVILSDEGEAWSLFFEGNRQYPGGVVYAFSPFWLTRRPSPSDATMETLYVHKAITADAAGQTYLDTFSPPRRVTYMVNHLICYKNDIIQVLGRELNRPGLDTPMSSSTAISEWVNDKLFTRTMCAAADVGHPVTLGFWLPGESSPDYPDYFPSIRVVKLATKNMREVEVESHVRKFLESHLMKKHQKVVVKAYGLNWYCSKGVSFHRKTDVKAIVASVLDLIDRITPGQGVLLESFVATLDRVMTSAEDCIAAGREEGLQCRMRVIVSKTPTNGARMTTIVCGFNDISSPVNGDNTVPMSFELMLHKWGIDDVIQQKKIRDIIRRKAEGLFLELLEQEKKLTAEQRGGVGAQLDMFGLDVVLTKLDDVITPVVIEVNGQGCIDQPLTYEVTNPDHQGEVASGWVQTLIARSQRFLLKDKVIVAVGAGQFSKRKLWQEFEDYGVKMVLVDNDLNHPARNQVYRFINVQFEDHTRDQDHASVIVNKVKAEVDHVDGCTTFWEDCVPLTSLVAEGLGLKYTVPYKAAYAAKCKGMTQSVLRPEERLQPPHAVLSVWYTSPIARITGPQDVEEAIHKVPLPAILKFEFGAGSVGVRHVTTYEEVAKHAQKIPNTLLTVDGLGFGDSLVLMPTLRGTEHHVALAMFRSQVTAAFVFDMKAYPPPLCLQALAGLPSHLCDEQQRQLISAAVACCRGLGLDTGVFDVGFMMTTCGPKLLEVNGRMGGMYTRNFVQRLYDTDLAHLALMACCGIRPVSKNNLVGGVSTSKIRETKGQIVSIMLFPGRHGKALETVATPQHIRRLHDQGVITFIQFEEEVDGGSHEYESPYGALCVHGKTVAEACAKLKGVCLALELETEESLANILRDYEGL